MLKRSAFIVLISFLLLSFPACSRQDKKQGALPQDNPGVSVQEILIGSSSALSGHTSFLGTQYTHGALSYINEVNKSGIFGRRINLVSLDDQYDPPQTVSNTQRLIVKDRVFCLFNYVGTPTSVKIIDLVNKAKIPAVGFLTGAEILRNPVQTYIFNVRDSYYAEAAAAVNYFVKVLGLKRVGVMYQKDAFGLAVLQGVQIALKEHNLEPVVTASFQRGTMDVEEAFATIGPSNCQAVLMVGTYAPLAKYIDVSVKGGQKPYFHTVSFVGSEAFAKELTAREIDPGEHHKIIVTQVVPSPFDESFEVTKEYRGLLKQYFPEDQPNYVSFEGFINAKVLVEALQRSGQSLSRGELIEALHSLNDFDPGIKKAVTFSSNDHQGLQGVYYSRFSENGAFEIFNP